MLVSRQVKSEPQLRQGSRSLSLAELRRELETPSKLKDGPRQRLLELAQRAAKVQGLGGEYGRVSLSDFAHGALSGSMATA